MDGVPLGVEVVEVPEPPTGEPPPLGEGNGSGGCGSLVPTTASNASLPVYLLIPAFIPIARLWRRRINQKQK